MLFKSQTKTPKYEIITTRAFIPEVVITQEALAKMQLYVEGCTDEIGWLATAVHEDGVITITDTLLLDQDVHATTTEITVDGLSALAEELLAKPDGMETWNNIKVWGHSHVNMATSPSGQDDKQMHVFADSGHEWFIRLIANKKGDMRVDFYNFEHGIAVQNMGWTAEELQESEDAQNYQVALNEYEEQIKELEETRALLLSAIEEEKDKHVKAMEPEIKEEMKRKVRKKSYYTTPSKSKHGTKGTSSQSFRSTAGSYNYWSGYGSYDGYGYEHGYEDETWYNDTPDQVFLDDRHYQAEDYKPEDVVRLFHHSDRRNIARAQTIDELASYFFDSALGLHYTRSEAMVIWNFCKQEQKQLEGTKA